MAEPLEATLRRLKQERDEADRRYNDALTALDRAQPPASEWPLPRPATDDSQLGALNHEWSIVPGPPPAASGWRGRLSGFIWRVVAPYLERQLTFNSRLVDHLNRQASAARDAQRSAEESAARLHDQAARLAEFHATMMRYLQQITAYIDTRDRDVAGSSLVVNASLSGVVETFDKRWESLSVRDQRNEARAARLAADHEDLRTLVNVSQQAAISLKREVEKILAGPTVREAVATVDTPATEGATFRPLDSYKYVGFEDRFRGSRQVIRERLESYLPIFVGTADVLDIGCGRGEFLELLAGAGVRARGIDLNHEMAEQCRSRGLDVTEADAVSYLSTLPDASLGGLFAAQVVEHLQPEYLLRMLELAAQKLRPGGRLVLETLNPACWVAFFDSYIRDITHVLPLHPETLKYLVLASGFSRADVEYRSPVAPQDRLQTVALANGTQAGDLIEAFNANVEKLNARLFTHLDYAVIGAR
jgi:SAM-dependent methyltransferase/prefoldin subunit 5